MSASSVEALAFALVLGALAVTAVVSMLRRPRGRRGAGRHRGRD
jgi:hypothetical protein